MKDWYVPLAIGIVTLVAIGIGTTQSYFMIQENPFEAKDLFKRDMNKPVLWIFYDTSVLNSRNYSDFGSRSSRALNLPFLNLCYESIVKHNSSLYRIEAIDGLPGLAKLLGGWETLPQKLQNPLVTLEPSDFAWIRSAILAHSGGLWVAPTTICLRPFGKLPDKSVFFGTDPDESFAGTSGTAVPNFQVAWSPIANNPLWVAWEAKSRQRLNTSGGGDTARSADKWEFMALKEMFGELEIRPLAEVGRKGAAGRRIQLEDLLAAGQEGKPIFEIGANAVYVALPWAELRDRRAFGWFLKMSESQIAESDLVIRDLFQLAGVL
jgi:hypothetical protein